MTPELCELIDKILAYQEAELIEKELEEERPRLYIELPVPLPEEDYYEQTKVR